MKGETLLKAKAEAARFLDYLKELEDRMEEDPSALDFGCRETGAVKRSSLDLSRVLADLRQGR